MTELGVGFLIRSRKRAAAARGAGDLCPADDAKMWQLRHGNTAQTAVLVTKSERANLFGSGHHRFGVAACVASDGTIYRCRQFLPYLAILPLANRPQAGYIWHFPAALGWNAGNRASQRRRGKQPVCRLLGREHV